MAEQSKIEWTDNTFNPWIGCTKVSPACKNCYAERDFDHRFKTAQWGPNGTRVKTSEANWNKPLLWNRKARADGVRVRVFCASLADVFEDWRGPIVDSKGNELVKTMDDLRRDLFELIDATPNLDWMLLTKRPENIRRMWDGVATRHNVWLGTSVESSEYLFRIDALKAAGSLADVLFVSAEPIVGPMPTLGEYLDGIDLVIAGGESGPDARPSNPNWFRSVRDQCETYGVPFNFKQWGEFGPAEMATPVQINNAAFEVFERGERVYRIGKHAAGRLLDGEEFNGVPTKWNPNRAVQ